MNFSSFSPVAIATTLWANSTRSLTSLGTALTEVLLVQQTLAASTNVFYTPGAGHRDIVSVGAIAGAANVCKIGITDGTSFFPILSVVAGTLGAVGSIVALNGMSVQISNTDGANAAKYSYAAIDLS